jgi:uncharacterized NAD(P)/FAD-binding protein YdhS
MVWRAVLCRQRGQQIAENLPFVEERHDDVKHHVPWRTRAGRSSRADEDCHKIAR